MTCYFSKAHALKDCAHIEVLLQKLYESPLQQAMKPNRQILRYVEVSACCFAMILII